MTVYLLITDSTGGQVWQPIESGAAYPVEAGDDFLLVDALGHPVEAQISRVEEDLEVELENGQTFRLQDFYRHQDTSQPASLSVKADPDLLAKAAEGDTHNSDSPGTGDYHLNQTVGNLPGAGEYTLMKFSSSADVDFGDEMDVLTKWELVPYSPASGNLGLPIEDEPAHVCPSTSAGNGGETGVPDSIEDPSGGNEITVNHGPDAIDDVLTTPEDTPVTVPVRGNDTDTEGDPLTVVQTTHGSNGVVRIDQVTGNPVYTPNPDFNGTDSFTYTIDDGNGATDTATVTVDVGGANDAPVARPDSASVEEGATVLIGPLVNDTDPDGDPLSVTGIEVGGAMVTPVVGNPITLDSGATVVLLADGTMDYTPPASANGLDAGESLVDVFTYKIDDGNGGTATAATTVTVTGEDDPTVTNPDVDVTDEDTAIVVDVLANDSDADTSDNPLSVTNVAQPPAGQGSVVNNGNNVTFDPGTDFQDLAVGETEIVKFTYDATTPGGGTTTENVTITVVGTNNGPDAIDDAITTPEDTPVTVPVRGNDTDLEGEPLTVVQTSNPSNGVVTIDR